MEYNYLLYYFLYITTLKGRSTDNDKKSPASTELFLLFFFTFNNSWTIYMENWSSKEKI